MGAGKRVRHPPNPLRPAGYRKSIRSRMGAGKRVRYPPNPLRPAGCRNRKWIRSRMGAGGRVRRPPNPLRPAGCRCRVRVGGQAGPCDRCGFKGMRAAEIRTALPAFLRKEPFAFPLPFARCRAGAFLRRVVWLPGNSKRGQYGERRVAPRRIRERRAGRRRRTNRHNLARKCRSARKGQRRTEPLSTGGRCRQDVGGSAENREVLSKWNRKNSVRCAVPESFSVLLFFLSLRF